LWYGIEERRGGGCIFVVRKGGTLTCGRTVKSNVSGGGTTVDEGGIRVNGRKDDVKRTSGRTAITTSCEVGYGHCNDGERISEGVREEV